MRPCVLVVGYRQALAAALNRMGIAYSVWSDKPLKSKPAGVERVIVAPYPTSKTVKGGPADELVQQPTHVIAGSEAAVFPAAVLRRQFGARRSPDTQLIRCIDKAAMKNFLRKFDIPMTRYSEHSASSHADGLVEELGLPLVIKRKRGSGGRDIVIAASVDEVASNMHRNCIYEAFVDAREGSIEAFIENGKIVFTSITDYLEKKFANVVPAGFAPAENKEIERLNKLVIESLRIKWGLTHLEYYRTRDGLLFGEIALRPPGGYIMKLIEESYGFDPWELLIRIELGLPSRMPHAVAARTSGCLILHPGSGTVCAVNKPAKDDFPTLVHCSIKAKIGAVLDSRKGVGEDVGYCIFSSQSREQVLHDLDRLRATPPVRTGP